MTWPAEAHLKPLTPLQGSVVPELSDEIEAQVSHARLRTMTAEHPHDLSRALSALVRAGHLESTGATRGTVYFFPGSSTAVEQTRDPGRFPFVGEQRQLDLLGIDDADSAASLPHEAVSSPQAAASLPHRLEQPRELAAPVRTRQTAPRHVVDQVILDLCHGRYLTLHELAALLNRHPATLSNHYLSRLVREQRLALRHPGKPSHPRQAYTSIAAPAEPSHPT